jgi:uncharacterized membrane protein YkvA (DUF1232 family)
MEAFFSVIKMLIGCGTLLIVLLVLVAHLPDSPVRTLLVRICGWGTATLCGAAILSPIDPIPDVLFPIGFIDDVIYLVIAYQAIKAAWNAGKQKLNSESGKTRILDVKAIANDS